MKYTLILALLLYGAEASQAVSFSDFLKLVEERDPRTQAILKVKATEKWAQEHKPTTWWNCEITIDGKSATVNVSNSYKTGKEGETLHFRVDAAVKREAKRLEDFHHLQDLDREVKKAQMKRRIFVRSKFRLRQGDPEAKVLEIYGKPAKQILLNEAGCFGMSYDNVYVIVDGQRKVMDILPPDE